MKVVKLVSHGENGQDITINENFLQNLATIQGQICFVANGGLTGIGKSSSQNAIGYLSEKQKQNAVLSDDFFKEENLFVYNDSCASVTKGIWVNQIPIKIKTNQNQDLNIFLLDAEGLSAVNNNGILCHRFYEFMFLISEVFLYHIRKKPIEPELSDLKLIHSLSNTISSDAQLPFPAIFFIPRDRTNLKPYKNSTGTKNEYLDYIIKEGKLCSDLQKIIKDIVVIPTPPQLYMDDLDENLQKRKEQFQSIEQHQYAKSIMDILNKISQYSKKCIESQIAMNGYQISMLLRKIIQIINAGQVYLAKSSFDCVLQDIFDKECQRILEKFQGMINQAKNNYYQEGYKNIDIQQTQNKLYALKSEIEKEIISVIQNKFHNSQEILKKFEQFSYSTFQKQLQYEINRVSEQIGMEKQLTLYADNEEKQQKIIAESAITVKKLEEELKNRQDQDKKDKAKADQIQKEQLQSFQQKYNELEKQLAEKQQQFILQNEKMQIQLQNQQDEQAQQQLKQQMAVQQQQQQQQIANIAQQNQETFFGSILKFGLQIFGTIVTLPFAPIAIPYIWGKNN